MMRTLALGLLVADERLAMRLSPSLINEKEALRISIQGLVSAKARDTASGEL